VIPGFHYFTHPCGCRVVFARTRRTYKLIGVYPHDGEGDCPDFRKILQVLSEENLLQQTVNL
jgi:hypothetical protein